MVKCPTCGIEVEDGIQLCPNCASDLTNIKEEPEEDLSSQINSVNLCPSCSAELDDNVEFCSKCGTQIENFSNSVDTSNICPSCGVKLDSDSKFCIKCGANISGDSNEDNSEINYNNQNTKYKISNINFGRVILYSILSLTLAVVISTIILYLLGYPTFGSDWPYYPLAFYIGTIISIGLFAAFPKDKLEAGILGFIVGLTLFIFENTIISFVFNEYFANIYNLGYSGHAIGYIIVGIIIAILSQVFLKEIITEYIKLDDLF